MTDDARLTVELVPSSCRLSSLAHDLPREQWDLVRKWAYRQAGYRCAICGAPGLLRAHERWEYDEAGPTPVQRLLGVHAICLACHEVAHMDRTELRGGQAAVEAARRHLAEVNRWTEAQVEEHVAEAWRLWRRRSQRSWEPDVSWLDEAFGIHMDTSASAPEPAPSAGDPDEDAIEEEDDLGDEPDAGDEASAGDDGDPAAVTDWGASAGAGGAPAGAGVDWNTSVGARDAGVGPAAPESAGGQVQTVMPEVSRRPDSVVISPGRPPQPSLIGRALAGAWPLTRRGLSGGWSLARRGLRSYLAGWRWR